LREIRKQTPGVLLSDLNMPGMSGFELLSVVRRRFPAIRTIAMSGSFCGDEVPSGVAADAFFQKGSSTGALLRMIGSMSQAKPQGGESVNQTAPIWLNGNGHDDAGQAWITISCPECLLTFPQGVGGSMAPIRTAQCIHCDSTIQFAVVPQHEGPTARPIRNLPAVGETGKACAAQPYF